MDIVERGAELLTRSGLDAILCRLPQNVLLLSGYFPVLGNSYCLATVRSGALEVRLVVPEDERDLVPDRHSVRVETFGGQYGAQLEDDLEVVRAVVEAAGVGHAVIGYEGGSSSVVASYTQVASPGADSLEAYRQAAPRATWRDGSRTLLELGAVKPPAVVNQIRHAIDVARHGYIAARQRTTAGHTEADVAAAFLAAVQPAGYGLPEGPRLLAQVHVLSGPRLAQAGRRFGLTSNRIIAAGDPVLVQAEIAIEGYWATLSRTFFAGTVSHFWRLADETCRRAQEAALGRVAPGAWAGAGQDAARQVLQAAGLAGATARAVGHGIGYEAINPAAPPILGPDSDTPLEVGMVAGLELGLYVEEKGGVRLGDDVLVTEEGVELLSADIPRDLDWLIAR